MAYTQRWFGTGEWPANKPYSRDVHSDDLVAVLQAIGEPVHLVGLSNGGPPALWAAIRAPELVRSLVLNEANLPDVLSAATRARRLSVLSSGASATPRPRSRPGTTTRRHGS